MDNSFVALVKDKTNLIELVNEYAPEPLQPCGTDLWRTVCPHPHHTDATASFDVHLHSDGSYTWCCNGCHCGPKNLDAEGAEKNYGSDAIAFIMWMSDKDRTGRNTMGFYDAVEFLAKRAGIPIPGRNNRFYELAQEQRKLWLACEQGLWPDHRIYLHQRGLDDEDIAFWHLGSLDWYGVRISFPVIDHNGNFRGVSARRPDYENIRMALKGKPEGAKYVNSPNNPDIFLKNELFYGENVIDRSCKILYITEGVMDVIMAHKYGLKNVVATLGTSLTKNHVERIMRHKFQPVLVYDNDANQTGQNKTKTAVSLLEEAGIYARVVQLPSGKDLAELSLAVGDKLTEYMEEHTQSYIEYRLAPLAKSYKAKRTELQQAVMVPVLKILSELETEEEIALYKSRVKEEFDLNL